MATPPDAAAPPGGDTVDARLLAAHHPHPTGLGALTRKDAFLRDPEVQRMLLRNVQSPPALLQRIFHQLSIFGGGRKTDDIPQKIVPGRWQVSILARRRGAGR